MHIILIKKVFLIFYKYLFIYIYKNKIYEVIYKYAMLCCTLCYTKRTENDSTNILFISIFILHGL